MAMCYGQLHGGIAGRRKPTSLGLAGRPLRSGKGAAVDLWRGADHLLDPVRAGWCGSALAKTRNFPRPLLCILGSPRWKQHCTTTTAMTMP